MVQLVYGVDPYELERELAEVLAKAPLGCVIDLPLLGEIDVADN
jgi:hypothetical protein